MKKVGLFKWWAVRVTKLKVARTVSVMNETLLHRPPAVLWVMSFLFAAGFPAVAEDRPHPLDTHTADARHADVAAARSPRLRVLMETDAGGDPDDQASLVRFLMYSAQWDVEGIIADRPRLRNERFGTHTGLDLVLAYVDAYAKVHPNLILHDARFPTPDHLRDRTVAGYDDTDDGVDLIVRVLTATTLGLSGLPTGARTAAPPAP